jgi:hypothetical protein
MSLINKGRLNQRATLALLDKMEQLRASAINELCPSDFAEEQGPFRIEWRIRANTPYAGTFQIQCRVIHPSTSSVIVESIFYRSE